MEENFLNLNLQVKGNYGNSITLCFFPPKILLFNDLYIEPIRAITTLSKKYAGEALWIIVTRVPSRL